MPVYHDKIKAYTKLGLHDDGNDAYNMFGSFWICVHESHANLTCDMLAIRSNDYRNKLLFETWEYTEGVDNRLRMNTKYNTNSSAIATTTVNLGQWYHVFWGFSLNGNTGFMYVDGTLIATGTPRTHYMPKDRIEWGRGSGSYWSRVSFSDFFIGHHQGLDDTAQRAEWATYCYNGGDPFALLDNVGQCFTCMPFDNSWSEFRTGDDEGLKAYAHTADFNRFQFWKDLAAHPRTRWWWRSQQNELEQWLAAMGTAAFDLDVQALSRTRDLEAPSTMTGTFNVLVDALARARVLDAPTATGTFGLTVDALLRARALDAPVASAEYALTVDSLNRGRGLDAPAVAQEVAVAVDALLRARALDSVTIDTAINLVVESLSRSRALDAVPATVTRQLVVDSLLRARALDSVTVGALVNLQVAELSRTRSLDTLTVSQVTQLAVDALLRSRLLDNVVIDTGERRLIEINGVRVDVLEFVAKRIDEINLTGKG